MIYTSYYKNLVNLPDNLVPIGISRQIPEWYKGVTYQKVAPSYELLKMYHRTNNSEMYTKKYLEELSRLDLNQVANDLNKYGSSIVLLCYEVPNKFCHRHILSNELNKLGISCKEW